MGGGREVTCDSILSVSAGLRDSDVVGVEAAGSQAGLAVLPGGRGRGRGGEGEGPGQRTGGSVQV